MFGSRSFPDSARLRFAPWDALLARFGHGATEPRGDTEKRHVGALQLENSASIILIDAHPAMPTSRRPRRRVHFGDAVVVEEPRRRPLGQSVHIMTGLTPGVEVNTCLPLQMAVYFNVFYAPLWAIGSILSLQTKFSQLETHYHYINVLVAVVMMSTEAGRLYLAYEGNLREKVAELAGFWLLSLLQTLLALYALFNPAALPLPLDISLSVPLLLFLLVELILGLWTLCRLVNSQALKFHVLQNSQRLPQTQSSSNDISSRTDTTNGGDVEHVEMAQLS